MDHEEIAEVLTKPISQDLPVHAHAHLLVTNEIDLSVDPPTILVTTRLRGEEGDA
jgi:hypothetical protein